MTCEDAPSIDYMARYIAKLQQSYTQRGGVRPFGVSSMLAGFTDDGAPHLFLTDPAGIYSEWKSNAIGGRNEKAVNEFLEKNWTQGKHVLCCAVVWGGLLYGVVCCTTACCVL